MLDLVLFTFFLIQTGGPSNPFYGLFYILAAVGGTFIWVRLRTLYLGLLLCCVSLVEIYPALTTNTPFVYIFNFQTFPFVLTQILLLWIVFLIASSYGQWLERDQELLLNAKLSGERADRLRSLGALSAGFSHEFASPLTTAQIRLGRLSKGLSEQSEDYLACKEALERCERVLKQMNLSQIDFGSIQNEEINVAQVLAKIIGRWKQEYPAISVETILIDEVIHSPKVSFAQATVNVLDNAAYAMSYNGNIRVVSELRSGLILINFYDEGGGFNSEILSHIGQPFNTNKPQGTGLGLYSASRLSQKFCIAL